jgi:hypothetical protein
MQQPRAHLPGPAAGEPTVVLLPEPVAAGGALGAPPVPKPEQAGRHQGIAEGALPTGQAP